jgi:hypothetical protein
MWGKRSSCPGETRIQSYLWGEDGGDPESAAYCEENNTTTKDLGRAAGNGEGW